MWLYSLNLSHAYKGDATSIYGHPTFRDAVRAILARPDYLVKTLVNWDDLSQTNSYVYNEM